MLRDNKEFRERFQRWKAGELVYDAGRAIPRYEGGKDTTGRIQSAIPLEVQHDPLGILKAVRIVQENAARVAALNSAQIGPSLNTPKQLLDYYRDKAETEAFMLRKRAGELMADEMMMSLLDPRYIAAGWTLGIIGKAAKSTITGSKLYKNFRLALEINKAVKTTPSVNYSINLQKPVNNIVVNPKLFPHEEKAIPNTELLQIKNSTLERMADMRLLTGELRTEYIRNGMSKLGTKYTSTYKLNNPGADAEYNWSTGEIKVNPGLELFALGHEMRHKIDGIEWLTGEKGYTLTPEEYGTLRKAYTGPFLDYPGDMLREMTTVNADVRKQLIGAHNLRNMSIAEQNALIDSKNLGEVFEALKNSNDYGFMYYKSLMTDPIYRENNAELMINIGRNIKHALKIVGSFGTPMYLSIPKLNTE